MRSSAAAGAIALAGILASAGAAATDAEVTMPGKLYSPRSLDVLVGTTVTWRNSDRSTHTVTEDDDAFDSGHVGPGGTFAATFEETGTFLYHCTIHRFMRGSLRVFEVVLHGPDEPLSAGRRARLDGLAPAGATEVLLQRVLPGPAEIVGRAEPGPDGSFSFVVPAPEPRRYRVRAGSASSPLVRVPVAPHVVVGRRTRGIAVRVVPSRAGSRVTLQEYDRELFSFVTVARGRLDASSKAIVAYEPERSAQVRVVVPGREGWSDGVSRTLHLRPR